MGLLGPPPAGRLKGYVAHGRGTPMVDIARNTFYSLPARCAHILHNTTEEIALGANMPSGFVDSIYTLVEGTGKKRSIHLSNNWGKVDEFGNWVNLADIFEYGTPPHEILPRRARALKFPEFTGRVYGMELRRFAKRVFVSGIPPFRVMDNGMRTGWRRVRREVHEGVRYVDWQVRAKGGGHRYVRVRDERNIPKAWWQRLKHRAEFARGMTEITVARLRGKITREEEHALKDMRIDESNEKLDLSRLTREEMNPYG